MSNEAKRITTGLPEHESVAAAIKTMSHEEIFAISVSAGIHTPDGQLTEPYRRTEPDEAAQTPDFDLHTT